MEVIEQQHQYSKEIKKELVTINLKTPGPSYDTEVINKIPVKLPSQFLISKITTYFEKNVDPLSMNSRIEVSKFEPRPTFENTINESKVNNMKIIASATMNLSDITSFDENFKQVIMNSSIEVEKIEPEPKFEKTINEIKYNHLKSIASSAIDISAITLFENNIEPLSMDNRFEAEKLGPEQTFDKTINKIKDNHLKIITSFEMNLSPITSNKPSYSSGHLKYNFMPWILPLSPDKSPQFTNHLS